MTAIYDVIYIIGGLIGVAIPIFLIYSMIKEWRHFYSRDEIYEIIGEAKKRGHKYVMLAGRIDDNLKEELETKGYEVERNVGRMRFSGYIYFYSSWDLEFMPSFIIHFYRSYFDT